MKEHLQFAARLNHACTQAGILDRGRNTKLAKLFGVSPQAARKWVEGNGIPSMANASAIARELGVDVNWLLTGQASEKVLEPTTPEEKKMIQAMRQMQKDDLRALLAIAKRLASITKEPQQ